MRLSTNAERNDGRSLAVIHTALDAGATLLDTADAYCRDDRDVGHNERLVARALAAWNGDRARVTVATKGGIRRPNGAWLPDGRAKYLREACDASRRALGIDTIDLYQLHTVDPKTPLETSVRALARLQEEGAIRAIGLCNVTVSQIRAARQVAPIASVQVSLSPLDDENLRNGVAEYCREHGIRLIAFRPLGGERIKQLARNATLSRLAVKHAARNEEIVLAWLLSFGDGVVPIPGATRIETAASLARALALDLDEDDRELLDVAFSGLLLRVPRASRRPNDSAAGDVVLIMGMPGAGKSEIARALEAEGYTRLNRDTLGGSLRDLSSRLTTVLAESQKQVVLDNTYPSRKSRNEVIEVSWQHGVHVRCIWLTTGNADAQINCVRRMLEAHGSLPSPEEIRQLSASDTRYLLPDALFRYERTLESPTLDEGWISIDTRDFVRDAERGEARALILDFDDLRGRDVPALDPADVVVDDARRDILLRHRENGWQIFLHAWRPQIERGQTTPEEVDACFERMREILGNVDVACCPHDAGPPACWCRKPIPGSVLEFAARRDVALTRSVVVGRSAADKTLAERIGAEFTASASFFR